MNEKKPRRRRDRLSHLPSPGDTASFTECTGLMQSPPRSPEEWEAYRQLFTTDLTDDPFWHKSE